MRHSKDITTDERRGAGRVEGGKASGGGAVRPREGEAARPAKTTVRKGPGGKEVVPFKWKLVGESHGVVLTLFKAVEHEEAQAQLQRAEREGYYAKLRVLDVNEKIKQPASAKSAPRTGERKSTPKGAKPGRRRPTTKNAKKRATRARTAAGGAARRKTSRTAKPTKKKTAARSNRKTAARPKKRRTPRKKT